MRTIDPAPFTAYMGDPASPDLGMKPGLSWIPISALRIDPAYQREIMRHGARNIGKIARQFDWSLFGIVVVANIGDQLFAIVDGQHRTLGAALRGIQEVPCVIIEADPGKQAAAFAAINGAVTAISKLSIHAAEVAAGDPFALEVSRVCAAAGVEICKYPVPASHMRPGQTIAVQAIRECLKTYGADHLILSLKCVTTQGNVATGLVKAPIIKALCHVLDAEKSWKSLTSRLLSTMQRFDFAESLEQASIEAKKSRMQIQGALSLRLFDFLDEEIGA